MRKFVLPLMALLALTACNRSFMTEPPKSMQDQPAAWQEGYRAGCASGKNAAGNPYFQFEKDVNRFQKDRIYADGWANGYDHCKSRTEHNASLI